MKIPYPPGVAVTKHAPSGMWRWQCTYCGAAYESNQRAALVNGEAHYINAHLYGEPLSAKWWLN